MRKFWILSGVVGSILATAQQAFAVAANTKLFTEAGTAAKNAQADITGTWIPIMVVAGGLICVGMLWFSAHGTSRRIVAYVLGLLFLAFVLGGGVAAIAPGVSNSVILP
jgi:hypothetical protein